MSMFILAISCLTPSNLPWFMDLTIQFLCNIVEKAMATHSSILAWKIPWTEEPRLQSMGSLRVKTWLSNFPFTFHFSCIGEGNDNPLQCSCLENPRDGGAWWATVYGVAQSQTQLKRLSSSSMQYCSLQHRTLLLSQVTPTTGYCFCFGSIPLFFLELFLHWSLVAYWAPTDLGSTSFSSL